MQRYFFVLGRNPALSIVEITCVLKRFQTHFNLQVFSDEIATFTVDSAVDIPTLIKTLGGTIKIGQILTEVKLDESEDKFFQIFTSGNLLENYFPKVNGKLHLGISLYNGSATAQNLNAIFKQLKEMNVRIKDNLQSEGKKVGFVKLKDRYLSSVSVYKNQLLNKGVEIVMTLTPTSILVGKTLAVQEFAQFSFRDYGRPKRDKRAGILPPKLARMMINLVQTDTNAIILDPFCGSGTILQEAILLGYKNIIGSDLSKKAIDDTKANIDWLFKEFSQGEKSSYNVKLLQTDSRFITQHYPKNSIDAVVTEPYLGPPLFKKPNISLVMKILSQVSCLYLETFVKLATILKSNGKIIIIFPVFEVNGKLYFVEILPQIQKLGFRQKDFYQEPITDKQTLGFTLRNTILYGSREQFVRREILSFERIV